MKQRWLPLALAVLILPGPALLAQTVPAVPAPPPQAAGLLGLFQALSAKIAACKAKCCACPLGQMLQAMGQPLSMATGGMLFCPPCCPPINPNDLKKASNTPQGACAKIKQEEMEAPARRDAVRCLAFYDCHWFPEAEAALVTALRTDRNECVRYEAARVLGTGCCCTRKTIEALTLVVNSSSKDGNPSENSVRVKMAAYQSLSKCIDAFHEETEPKQPEKPPESLGPPTTLTARPVDEEVRLMAQAVASARKALEKSEFVSRGGQMPLQTGSRGLFDVMRAASSSTPEMMPSGRAVEGASVGQTLPPPLGQTFPTSAGPQEGMEMRVVPAPVESQPVSIAPTGRRGLFQLWSDSGRKPAEAQAPMYLESPR